jgi:hypothetical protein
MPTLEQIALGIEAALAPTGLRTQEYVPDKVTPPAAIIGLAEIPDHRVAIAGSKFDVTFTITVLTSAAYTRGGQLALLTYADRAGAASVFAAFEADRTLGGVVDDCQFARPFFRPLGIEEVGLLGYFGGVFTLRVMA